MDLGVIIGQCKIISRNSPGETEKMPKHVKSGKIVGIITGYFQVFQNLELRRFTSSKDVNGLESKACSERTNLWLPDTAPLSCGFPDVISSTKMNNQDRNKTVAFIARKMVVTFW